MASAAQAIRQTGSGWLRSRRFDYAFILGLAALGITSGLIVTARPELFVWVLTADLWLLGYHHVVATFTRLAFDKSSLRRYWFFVFALPPIVFASTFALAWHLGVWVVASVYLYWQWFHYTRQSWGISQVYRAKSSGRVVDGPAFSKICFYLVPLWGILYRSAQQPDTFLFMQVRTIAVPDTAVSAAGAAAIASVLVWAYTRYAAWRNGTLSLPHTLYMLSHFLVFSVGYVLIEDITAGWLVINVWHNAQYVLFVWVFNANRFAGGIEERARFLSSLSQSHNFAKYVIVCLAISTVTYAIVYRVAYFQTVAGLPMAIVAYQAINFHHYIVDSFLWKVRKAGMRRALGLGGGRGCDSERLERDTLSTR